MSRPPYSATPADIFSPQERPAVFTTPVQPGDVPLAIEAARLAYFRFENPGDPHPESVPPLNPEPPPQDKLEAALRQAGFTQFAYFNDPVPSLATLLSPGGAFKLPGQVLNQLLGAAAALAQGPGLSQLLTQAMARLPGAALMPGFTDTQGFAALRPGDGLALLAFRGSQADTLSDVLLDGQFLQVEADGWPGALHHGFARGATAVWPSVEKWLTHEGATRKRLLVCGHSLGAAIATLVTQRAHGMKAGQATQLVTLGSPRVGNQEFADAFNATGVQATRLVDCIDAVTHVPPPHVTLLNYVHVGQETYIDRAGNASATPTADNDPVQGSLAHLQQQLQAGIRPGIVLPVALTDHAPVNYLRAFWP